MTDDGVPERIVRISRVAGRRVRRLKPLGGGCVGDVYKAEFDEGAPLVAKVASSDGTLALEGFMLEYLSKAGLPVPEVIHAENDLLLMTWIEGSGSIDGRAQEHAADLLAALHGRTQKDFGFERATLIGGLSQPNDPAPGWTDFFRDRRLLYMAGEGLKARRLPAATMTRIENLAARLGRWMDEPAAPSLIHGDMWGGNVLARDGKIAGFVDPAIYFADAEIELAFSTLFSTFGDSFFRRYAEHRPIRPGFFEARRDLLNLYPLLVHVRLFGGSYVGRVETTLSRFGC